MRCTYLHVSVSMTSSRFECLKISRLISSLFDLVKLQHSSCLERSVDSLLLSEFATNSSEAMNAGAEGSDGEEVPPTIPEEPC